MGEFLASLTTANWIAIVAGLFGLTGATFGGLNYFAGRRERRLRSETDGTTVKAVINSTRYRDGWRSVQLHAAPVVPSGKVFRSSEWRIVSVELLSPRSAKLARAEKDDYATGSFDDARPIRKLDGKAEGQPQRFALEFFIRFASNDDREKEARFRVKFASTHSDRVSTVLLKAKVPASAA